MDQSVNRSVFGTRAASLLIAAVALALPLPHASAGEEAQSAGFKQIFNGKDLTGWDGQEGSWTVEDGAITCTGRAEKRNWLIWRGGEPGDFILKLKMRFIEGNSGVQVRSHEIKPYWVRGYQVEVAEQNKMGLWHHSISPHKRRHHLALAGQKVHIHPDGSRTTRRFAKAKKVQQAYDEDGWNELTVIARGPKVVQKINGQTFAILIDEDKKYSHRSGLIALQDHGHGTGVQFKAIRLKRMDD